MPQSEPRSESQTDGVDAPAEPPPGPTRLDVLKTLGDNTRYAIYLELARSPVPLGTAEIAESLDLHPNTVRPHLERMRDVGLVDLQTATRHGVGRPQHLYSLASDAPSLGLEPPAFPRLARMLLRVAASSGADASDALDAGREQGREDARLATRAKSRRAAPCLSALIARLGELGFDPEVVEDGEATTIGFAHCPFRDLAEARPDLVCSLHQGIVEGFVDELGGAEVQAFHGLTDRTPCQVEVVAAGSTSVH